MLGAQILKGDTGRQIFEKLFDNYQKFLYFSLKINKKLCTGAFEFDLQTRSVMQSNLLLFTFKKLRKIFPTFQSFDNLEGRGYSIRKIEA